LYSYKIVVFSYTLVGFFYNTILMLDRSGN